MDGEELHSEPMAGRTAFSRRAGPAGGRWANWCVVGQSRTSVYQSTNLPVYQLPTVWRRGRDLNPRGRLALRVFETRALGQTMRPLPDKGIIPEHYISAKSLALGVYDLPGIGPSLAEGNVKQALRTTRPQKSSFYGLRQKPHMEPPGGATGVETCPTEGGCECN